LPRFARPARRRDKMAALVRKTSGGPDSVGMFLTEIHANVGVKIDAPETCEYYSWFEKFREVQTAHQVEPADIGNMDETGIAIGVCMNQTVVGNSSITRSFKPNIKRHPAPAC
jgi:hypothetical protein